MLIRAIRLAELSESEYWKTVLLNAIGVSYLVQSQYVLASEYLFDALKIANNIDSKERIARTYNNIGILNREIGNHRDALMYYLRALDMYETTADKSNTANVLNNISVLYSELKNFEKALEYNYRSYDQFLDIQDSIGIHSTMSGRGRLYLESNVLDSALFFINLSINIASRNNYKYGLTNSLRYAGGYNYATADYEKAVFDFWESYRIAKEINAVNNQVFALFGIIDCLLMLQRYDEALEHAQNAAQLSDEMANLKIIGLAHQKISIVYDSLKEYQLAHQHFLQYIEIRDALTDQYSLHQIYNLEIERLNEIMQNSKLEVQRQEFLVNKRNSTILLISIIFVSIIVTLVLVISRIRQAQLLKFNEALIRHTKERSKAALDAEVTERRRLGIELHDGVGPLLSLAKLNISALIEKPFLKPQRKDIILENTMSTLNEILRELKSISHNMAPVVLIEKGFNSAIKNLVNKLNETQQYSVHLDISGLDERLDSYLEHTLYRSILEIINNILMHAKGSEINIQIVQNDEDITVMIEDNGIGFVVEAINSNLNGLGLKSTKSRIIGINGKFYVDSVIGRGTIITIVVPLLNM
jgi:two-component system, NarL family, sensor kinase